MLVVAEARLLLLPSRQLDDTTVDGLFDGIEASVQAGRQRVVLPSAQSFTVTSHRTSLPLVLRNEGERPLQVLLAFRSGELEFTGDNPRLVTLQPGVNDLDIPIRTRRSGQLEFSIDVTSPDAEPPAGRDRGPGAVPGHLRGRCPALGAGHWCSSWCGGSATPAGGAPPPGPGPRTATATTGDVGASHGPRITDTDTDTDTPARSDRVHHGAPSANGTQEPAPGPPGRR